MQLQQGTNSYSIISISLNRILNGIDTCTVQTVQELDVTQEVVLQGVFRGYIVSSTISYSQKRYEYVINSPLELLKNKTFTLNAKIDTQDFTQTLSVAGCSISNTTLSGDDLAVNIDVSGQSYFDVFRRLSEIKYFNYYFDYSLNKVVVIASDYRPILTNKLEVTQIQGAFEGIINKIYAFSTKYNLYSISDVITRLTIESQYQLEKDDKGWYIADYESIKKHGVREKQEIIDDYDISNVLNSNKIATIQNIYETAVNQLKQFANPIYTLSVKAIQVQTLENLLGFVYSFNDQEYLVTAVAYTFSQNVVTAQLTLANQAKNTISILRILRRLNRNLYKKAQTSDTITKSYEFSFDEKNDITQEIDLSGITNIVKLEAFYTVTSDFAIIPKLNVILDDSELFYAPTFEIASTSTRYPSFENADYTSMVGDTIAIKAGVKNKLRVINNSEVGCKVVISFLIQTLN